MVSNAGAGGWLWGSGDGGSERGRRVQFLGVDRGDKGGWISCADYVAVVNGD